jgi:hypothetical protein
VRREEEDDLDLLMKRHPPAQESVEERNKQVREGTL